ncbi:MAG: helix-turn-helix transcriptional regulator [Acidobacteriota bacterium]
MSEAFEKEAVGAAVRPAAAVRQVGVSRRRLESLRLLPQQRQPLAEILSQSGAIDEAELGRLRRELSDLWCQVHGVTSGSLEEQDVRFQLLRVLKEGESVEDVTRLFVRSLSESVGKKRDGAESRPREELPRVNELAERAESLIRSRCHERLSLGDLAQALAVSREHLSRVFKRCHG